MEGTFDAVLLTVPAPQARVLRLPEPGYLTAHRWRCARVARPPGEDCLWDSALALGACGDWCLAGRVEAALLPGAALAGG